MLLALSEYELALLSVAAVFVAFALIVALVIPRSRPEFPGKALGIFILVCLGFFAAQLTAVFVDASHEEQAEAAETHTPTTLPETITTETTRHGDDDNRDDDNRDDDRDDNRDDDRDPTRRHAPRPERELGSLERDSQPLRDQVQRRLVAAGKNRRDLRLAEPADLVAGAQAAAQLPAQIRDRALEVGRASTLPNGLVALELEDHQCHLAAVLLRTRDERTEQSLEGRAHQQRRARLAHEHRGKRSVQVVESSADVVLRFHRDDSLPRLHTRGDRTRCDRN